MPESFEVVSSSGNYIVTVGHALLENVLAAQADAIVLVDQRFAGILPDWVTKRILVEANESRKSLESMPEIIIGLRDHGASRSTRLIAIGGGVIQDIATFAASVYMRGIRWTYMPTTLLGMADSCIGGKSSINVLGYKNLIGNFYPPDEVLIDVAFIQTLSAEHVVGGLFEAAKICYAHGSASFGTYLAAGPSWPLSQAAAQTLLLQSLKTKKWFIEIDEFDQAERLLLNFGHTFGHALEAATDFGVSHGMAVGVGMLVAIDYAWRCGLLSGRGDERALQLATHIESMLSLVASRGVHWPRLEIRDVMKKFDNDKKHRAGSYRIVLPTGDGALELVTQTRDERVWELLATSYTETCTRLGFDCGARGHNAAPLTAATTDCD